MKPIELERWEPSPDDPRREVYAGQRTAQEVFEELKHRLEGMGYLPDEYFLMDRRMGGRPGDPQRCGYLLHHRLRRQRGDLYLDVYLKWYGEDGKPVIRASPPGKTLGESGSDTGPDVPHLLRHHQGVSWRASVNLCPVPSAWVNGTEAGGHDAPPKP